MFIVWNLSCWHDIHKWCCERILMRFRVSSDQRKVFYSNISCFKGKKLSGTLTILLKFIAYAGTQISWKMTNFFFQRYGPEICRATAQMVLRTNFKAFWVVSSEKKFFWKLPNFLTFFAYPGSQISWKMTNYFFERYRPEICRGLHKWCCERILRCLRLFRA